MPRGASDIPELRLERLNKLVTRFTTPPNLVLMNMFGSSRAESDTIKWESIKGTRGMTPFVPPGSPAPTTAPSGVAAHSATAAYFKEKMPFDEEFLNNLRQEGTVEQYANAKKKLAREMQSLRNRCDRRKEWMFAQVISNGSLTYTAKGGVKISVDYGIPSGQVVTLANNRLWSTGADRNVLEDIMDIKITLSRSVGAKVSHAFFTSEIVKYLALDSGLQTLLQKSAFGSGDLFNKSVGSLLAVNVGVLGSLLDIPNMVVYDEQFVVRAWLTAAVTGSSTTVVSVDDTTDFYVGGTLRFWDTSAGTFEDETISAVGAEAGTVTVSTAPTASFKAGEDYVEMTKPFLPTNKFLMFADTIEGQKTMEWMDAPFGLNRNYGMYVDQNENWDPEVVWIRVQNKGLPVLYQEDAFYALTVA
jgi:hypothetical protein